ncbi:MAG: nuclear transport factor 2 family protein [Thermoleophilia bacterium]
MSDATTNEFDRRYLATWTEPDARRRRAAVESLWATDGRMVVAPHGLTLRGVDQIAAHVDRVHEENIAGRGLTFAYDQRAEADEALMLRWSMLAPDGGVVGRGVDVVFRDGEGAVRTVYMFTGVS